MSVVCVIGSAAADIKARMARPALETTDVPGRITLTPGGVARNIAENLARLGADAIFIGAMGDDAQARSVIEQSRAAGVDMRPILRSDLPTASLAVTLDVQGSQIAGVFSGEILETLTPSDLRPHLDAIRSAGALIADGGLPESVLVHLSETISSGSLFCCTPGSAALASRLRPIFGRCDLITCNHLEAEAVTDRPIASPDQARRAAQAVVARGAKRAVITLGPRGLAYADASDSGTLPALPTRLVDATGAGDALAAAMVFALLQGDSFATALWQGLRAAALTCEVETSVSAAMSIDALRSR
jgi:pseudouridine kinase